MRQPFVIPASVKSFHDYFNLSASVDTIAEALGYSFHRVPLPLPSTTETPEWVPALADRLTRILPHIALDYLLQTSLHHLLVVEAKNADTSQGMSQLVAEIAALDQWITSDEPVLWGALSTGDIWRFAHLERGTKTITQDVNLFRVPADLAELSRVLVGILKGSV